MTPSDLNRQWIQRENEGAAFSIRVGLMAGRDFFLPSPLLLFLEIGVDQSADELSARSLHAGDDALNVIRSDLIKIGRDANVLLWRPGVEG